MREKGTLDSLSQAQYSSKTLGIFIVLRSQGSKDTSLEASILPWTPQGYFQHLSKYEVGAQQFDNCQIKPNQTKKQMSKQNRGCQWLLKDK